MSLTLEPFDLLAQKHWAGPQVHRTKTTFIAGSNLIGRSDYGFRKYLETHYEPDMGRYYQEEQSHRTLFELIHYMDDNGLSCVIDYFDFPKDIAFRAGQRSCHVGAFVGWCWNNIATDPEWEIPDHLRQHQVFPFQKLYAIYQFTRKRQQRWTIYRDKITDAGEAVFNAEK